MSFQEIYDEVTYKEPIDIPNDGDWCNNPTDRQHSGIREDWADEGEYKKPKKVRCPTCNRYLTPKVVYTGCPCCGPYIVLPKHKKKFHDRPSNKKARKKTGDKGYKR